MPVRNSLSRLFRLNLTLRQKLVAVCLMFALPIGFLLYLLLAQQDREVAQSQKEVNAAGYLRVCANLLEHIAQHRAALGRQLAGDRGQPEEVARLAAAIDADLKALETIDGLAGSAGASPSQAASPSPGQRTTRERVAAVRRKWQRIGNRTPGTTPAVSDGWHQELSDEVLALNGVVLEESAGRWGQEAEARLKQLAWNRFVTLTAVTAAVALTLALVSFILRGLAKQVNGMVWMFSEIGRGNFKARAPVYNEEDELGRLALSLNAMLDNTLGLMQSREERDQIQASITKLLEEISGVAEGDLTKEAEVTADVTGAIADSFNFMIEQLRRVISNVQDATLQVSSAANEIHTTAEQLVHGSEGQARQIIGTTASVRQITESMQKVADNANRCAEVAQQSLASARQGSEAVHNTMRGMGRIRDQVQETAKRIKRLGESTQQIGEIVQLIDDIADRTSILALNASIQAAMAGEAGRGFAVVAEEVERLAERSANATKKIAGLVKTIQSETTEGVTAMEENTREVVEGTRLANQAGQALGQIETVTNQLAGLIQAISEAARQQAAASEGIARSMNEISEVTQKTAAGTRQGAISGNHLAELADDLRAPVSAFRLPGRNLRENGALRHPRSSPTNGAALAGAR
jgi:methyl-accepting chemotaxis protein